MIDFFFENINEISVSFLLLIAIIHAAKSLLKGEPLALDNLLAPAMSAATLPTGFALIICAFSPTNVSRLESINVHLAIAGIALIFLAVHTINEGMK